MNALRMVKHLAKFAGDNASPILAGFAVAGVVASVVMAVKAAPKAKDILEERQDEINSLMGDAGVEDEEVKKYKKELNLKYFKELAKVIAPVALTVATTIFCIIGSAAAGLRKQAALAAACHLTESAYSTFYDKTKEIVGDEKFKEIEKEVATEQAKTILNPEAVDVGYGEVLMLEPTQNGLVSCSKDKMEALEKEIELELTKFDFYQLASLYEFLNLPSTIFGDTMGWDTVSGDRRVDITLIPWSTADNRPCYKINYSPAPHVI